MISPKPSRALRLAAFAVMTFCLAGRAGTAGIVDFQDLSLAPNSSHINGAFQSGGVGFNNQYDSGFWDGFAYSNSTDPTPGFFNDTTAIPQALGGVGSNIYGVAHGYHDIVANQFQPVAFDPMDPDQLRALPTISLASGSSLLGLDVTNTTYAYFIMRDGDPNNFSKKFGGATGTDPDYFKLTAYGTIGTGANTQVLSQSVDFYLADFRSDDPAKDYIVSDWRYMDLTALGGATEIHFNLSSSDVGNFGLNTPGYFALDNLVLNAPQVVPEPSSLALIGVGMAGAGLLLARKRRAA